MSEERARILVVDDNPTKRYVISSWLRRAGHQILEAATGYEALERLTGVDLDPEIDLVVLDVRLPDISGFAVCERIKGSPATRSLPVVHISADAVGAVDRTEGLTRGADAYLSEPIDPDEMLATVQALLRYFRARQRAERLAERLALLAETTLAVNQAATFGELLEAAAAGSAAVFGRAAAVAAITPDGERRLARCAGPLLTTTVAPWTSGDGRIETDARTASRLWPEDGHGWPELELAGNAPVWVAMAVPRAARPPAYVVVPAAGLNADDAHVLTQLSQAVALAINAMRSYDDERRIALTLQNSLLPRELPVVPGIDLAVRYVPASDEAEIGGDFYELLLLDDVLVAAIGDVAGHSLHAATVMGELRHVLRAYVAEGHPPAEVIRRLNAMMLRLLPEETATLCILALEINTGEVKLANAGHIPPILTVPGMGATLIEHRTPLLGVDVPRHQGLEMTLPPGATLVLVTDGLIERREVSVWDSLEELRRCTLDVDDDLEAFCDRLTNTFITGEVPDDVAIVALRRRAY